MIGISFQIVGGIGLFLLMFNTLHDHLGSHRRRTNQVLISELQDALNLTQQFFVKIQAEGEDQPLLQSRVAQMHAIEHLARLQSYLQPPKFLQRMMAQKHLLENITLTREILKLGEAGLHHHAPENWLEMLEKKSLQLSLLSRQRRPAVLRQTAVGSNDPSLALDMLDAMRWLDRVGYHAWRISNYVSGEGQSEPLFSAQQ